MLSHYALFTDIFPVFETEQCGYCAALAEAHLSKPTVQCSRGLPNVSGAGGVRVSGVKWGGG
jgi:hypothetical protein